MRPRIVPPESGCLSVMLDPGESVIVPEHLHTITLHTGVTVPVIGGIGMKRPIHWLHVLWVAGVVWRAELLSDVPNLRPSIEALHQHWLDHPCQWKRL